MTIPKGFLLSAAYSNGNNGVDDAPELVKQKFIYQVGRGGRKPPWIKTMRQTCPFEAYSGLIQTLPLTGYAFIG